MLKKIILSMFLFSSFAFSVESTEEQLMEVVLKNGKYYIKDTDKLYSGRAEYFDNAENRKVIEEDYKDGLITQTREYYKSGVIKSITRYADGEPFLEEIFFEDGTLWERIFHKDGTKKYVYIKSDNSEEIYTPNGRTRIVKRTNGTIFKQDVKKDIFSNDIGLYRKEYNETEIMEKNEIGMCGISKEWKYGILVQDDIYGYDDNGEEISKRISYNDNILKIEKDNSIVEYFPNGNKKYEDLTWWDKKGKKHDEIRDYDESEKLISEKIYVNNETIKSDTKNYDKYYEMKENNKHYKIFYPNKKLAYEKYFIENDIKIEKYYAKNGNLVFEQKEYLKPYKINIKHWDTDKEQIKRNIKLIKKYTDKGQPIYIEKFVNNDKQTIFQKTSYHKNGKIFYDEKEIINKISENIGESEEYELKRYNENGKIEYFLKTEQLKRTEEHYKDDIISYKRLTEYNVTTKEEKETEISYYKNGKKRQERIVSWKYDTVNEDTTKEYSINGELIRSY